MGKKGKNRNGQNVRIIRVKKQKAGYEPPERKHSTSSEETQPQQHQEQEKQSSDLFQGYGAVDLSEKENTKPTNRKTDDIRASAANRKPAATTAVAPIIRPKGLTNLGNTCYFNSVLQVLSQTRLLREQLAQVSADGCEWEAIHMKNMHPNIQMKDSSEDNGPVKKEPRDDNNTNDEDDGIENSTTSSDPPENMIVSLPPAFEIFNCFADTLREIRSPSGSGVFTPNRMLNILGRKSCQFRGRDQQDSHELLRTLLDCVRTDEVRRKRKAVLTSLGISDVKNVDDDTKAIVKSYAASCNFSTIDSIFGGYILSTVRCEECDSTSQIFEQFYDLSLPISEGHPLPHAHQPSTGNSNKNNNNNNNGGNNRRGWEKKTKTTSNTAAIPLPAAGEAAATISQVKEKSKSDHKDGKSIANPGSGTAFKAGSGNNTVKSRKQIRAEKKAVRRAVKQEKKKQEKQNSSSVKAIPDGDDATDQPPPGDDFPAAGTHSKDESDAVEHEDGEEGKEETAGHGGETDESDLDIGEMVPLFSDLCISPSSKTSDIVKDSESRQVDASLSSTAAADASATSCSTSSLSSGRRDASNGCDRSNSNLRIDMSYSMNASHKNLDVRLQIETSNECNVNLAINHKTASGSRSTSFECNLKAEDAAADQEARRDAKDDSQVEQQQQQQRPSKEDDLPDPAVSEVASGYEEDEEKGDRLSSLSGGRRGDEEDEGVDENSETASSTRAMIDDQDLDDQMLAIDESLDNWGEDDLIEEFTVRGDTNLPFEDLEPPDVIDDDLYHDPPGLLLPLQLPGEEQQQEVPDAAVDLIPADSAADASASNQMISCQAIIPAEGAQNPDMKPSTESSSPTVATTTEDVIRRIRLTSESSAAMKRKVNWTLKTAEPAFTVTDNHPESPSIESCLSVFTLPELLTGSNKLSCENCSRNRAKEIGSSPGSKECKVLSNASKQMLIAYPPIILTLHLKRFYAEGYGQMHLRKINRHVRFPFILNLAPWVSQMYKRMGREMGVNEDANGTSLSYKLYGLVEHSGTLRSGHYTAMIRVRRKQSSSSSQDDDSKAMRAKYLRMKPFISSVESFLDSLHDLDHQQHREQREREEKQLPPTLSPIPHVNSNNDNNITDNGACCNSSNNQADAHLLSDDQKRLQSERNERIDAGNNANVNNNSGNKNEEHNDNNNSGKSNPHGSNRKEEASKKRETPGDDDEDEDKWFHVSDSHVAPTTRQSVLNAQAYILFYERI